MQFFNTVEFSKRKGKIT